LKTLLITSMLLPDNIHPENSIYFNGATILKVLREDESLDFLELYQRAVAIRQMSFQTYVLCLDWLYIIDVAELQEGKVSLCT